MVKDLIDKDIEETNNKPKGVRGENIRRILAELADFLFVSFWLSLFMELLFKNYLALKNTLPRCVKSPTNRLPCSWNIVYTKKMITAIC